jgi:GAF domain-containing protein
VRQKVHIPAYANLNGSRSGMVLDLNEIIDISEDGICIQTSTPLTPNRSLPVSLDLAETKAFIHTAGLVVWTDKSGRAGLRFPELPPQSRQQLQEWLFANAIAACVNHGEGMSRPPVASVQRVKVAAEIASAKENIPNLLSLDLPEASPPEFEPAAPLDYTSVLMGMAAVQKEVEAIGADQKQSLRVIAGCALTFTRATGAAIALSNEYIKSEFENDSLLAPLAKEEEMTCAAVAGCDAPPLGSHLHVGSGFSGECVRSRTLLNCEDAETDTRVDRETCRALGIRSMIAVPVMLNDNAIGLLEVFSPDPHAFSSNDDTVLARLAKMIAGAVAKANAPAQQVSAAPLLFGQNIFPSTGSFENEKSIEPLSESFNDRYSKILLIAAAATLLIVLLWLFASHGKNRAGANESQPPVAAETTGVASGPSTKILLTNNIEGLRRLALQGDALAQYALGVRYATGEEVKQDDSQALAWFTKAAEQGSVPGQATLGAYYWAGRGIPQDLKKAYFWAVLAQAGGDQGSKYRTAVLASRLTRNQIAAAQQQADDWIKTHRLSAKN